MPIFFISQAMAQTDIVGAYNSTHSGRNASLTLSKFLTQKHEIGGGVRINFNRHTLPDDQQHIFKKRLFTTKPLHHFGVHGFYHRHIFPQLKNVKPFLFYDTQLTFSTLRIISRSDGDIDFLGPFTWLEQNIGVGFKAEIASNWFIQQKIGYGTSFIMGYEDRLITINHEWFNLEFGYLLNVGIGYRFN